METINACNIIDPPFDTIELKVIHQNSKGVNIVEDYLQIEEWAVVQQGLDLHMTTRLDKRAEMLAHKMQADTESDRVFIVIKMANINGETLGFEYEVEYYSEVIAFPSMITFIFGIINRESVEV